MSLIQPDERDSVMARRVEKAIERARLKRFARYADDPALYATEVLRVQVKLPFDKPA
jgi:hypothetical protein